MDAGLITMTAFISPFQRDRRRVRDMTTPGEFHEIFCHASLEVCESRDVKGLYKKARAGEIPEFTGISSPYEEPEQAELIVEDFFELCRIHSGPHPGHFRVIAQDLGELTRSRDRIFQRR